MQYKDKEIFNLDEFKVLKHLAYKSFREENYSLNFLGAYSKNQNDTEQLTLQSCINFLKSKKKLLKIPTIKDIYECGLLKNEIKYIDQNMIDWENQLYSFIHLTF